MSRSRQNAFVSVAAFDGRRDDARVRVASALDDLAGHLLEHLEYEEENVAETMRSMTKL